MANLSESDLDSWVNSRMMVIGPKTYKGDWPCVCPNCGNDEGKFSVNTSKQMFNCWKSGCGYKGRDLKRLFQKYGPPTEDYTLDDSPAHSFEAEEGKGGLVKEAYYQIWEDNFKPLEGHPLEGTFNNFFTDRLINFDLVKSCGVRFCDENYNGENLYGVYKNYFGFPYRDETGKSIYFQFRIHPMHEAGAIKWKFPKVIGDFNKMNYVFSVSVDQQRAFVFESILDSLSFGYGSHSLGGSEISDEHVRFFQRNKFKDIYVIMDGDSAGKKAVYGKYNKGQKEWTDGIAPILQSFTDSRILVPPESYFLRDVDPDELPFEEKVDLVRNCREFNRLSLI